MRSVLRPTTLLLLGAALAACSDAPGPITGPVRSSEAPLRATSQGGGNSKSSLEMVEEDHSAGALDKENANRYRACAVHAPEKLPQKYKSVAIGKDATESMVRQALDWGGLSTSTKQEILELRANGFANLKNTFGTGHFVLLYSTGSASDAGVSPVPVGTASAYIVINNDFDGLPAER